MWSPVQGLGAYEWLSQVFGPSGIDLAVAACAAVCYQVASDWLMGPTVEMNEENRIIELDDDPPPSTSQQSESHHVLIFAGIMTALTLPSFVFTGTPRLPPSSTNTTPLTVGCVLPSTIYDQHHGSALEDFIAASAQMTSAKILIWPESAVTFENPEERDAAFDKVRREVRGPAVGVSFEEFVPAEFGRRKGMKRNGFALLKPNNTDGPAVALTYYKRHLVPSKSNACMLPALVMN
jgi:apolipoprotein N-acyltransferase